MSSASAPPTLKSALPFVSALLVILYLAVEEGYGGDAPGLSSRGGALLLRPPAVSCPAVWARHRAGSPATEWPPRCPLPPGDPLVVRFEGPNGSMPITREWCFAQRYEGEGMRVLDWNEAWVNAKCAEYASGKDAGTYGSREMKQVVEALRGVAGKSVIVLGSERPWVECVALNTGASVVWTWEYSTIASTHPVLHASPTRVMAAAFESGALAPFDYAVSFSSLEHSGLGRYGDALNPDGDAEALEEAWCMLRPGGKLFLGVPMSCQEQGRIEFNAHRVFGYSRLAYISKGWELAGFDGRGCGDFNAGWQAIVVLRKPMGGAPVREVVAADFAAAHEAAVVRWNKKNNK